MVAGSPYNRLVAVNNQPLNADEEKKAAAQMAMTISQRQRETDEQHSSRVAQYEKERRRDQFLLEQLTEAMEFSLNGTATVDGYTTYVLTAKPNPYYVAKNVQTKLFSGMKGTMWIDETSFRWVRVEVEVIHPVMIDGFVARVEPGTKFEMEQRRVENTEIWLPTHFDMHSRALIFLLFPRSTYQDETYFRYKPNGSLAPGACLEQ